MKKTSLPRVVYCGPDDAFFKKLSRLSRTFTLECRCRQLYSSPQQLARSRKVGVVILKVKNELDLHHQEWLSRSNGSVPVIVLCQNGTLETAIHTLQYGVYDYFCVKTELDVVIRRIEQAILWKMLKPSRQTSVPANQILTGQNPETLKLNDEAAALVKSNEPFILIGETGTGKEHVARSIYRLSGRDATFLRYDCRVLQQISQYDNLPISTLIRTQLNSVNKESTKNVVFLNHVEVLNATQQQELFFSKSFQHGVRVIASFEERGKRWSPEKFARGITTLWVPPLRQRRDDIPLLAYQFIRTANKAGFSRIKLISTEVIRLMQEYSWPGNVQELQNVIDRMLLIEPSPILTAESWQTCQSQGANLQKEGTNQFATMIEAVLKSSDLSSKKGVVYDRFMARMEKILIQLVLAKVDRNQATAAKILGISRNTLRQKLRSLA